MILDLYQFEYRLKTLVFALIHQNIDFSICQKHIKEIFDIFGLNYNICSIDINSAINDEDLIIIADKNDYSYFDTMDEILSHYEVADLDKQITAITEKYNIVL